MMIKETLLKIARDAFDDRRQNAIDLLKRNRWLDGKEEAWLAHESMRLEMQGAH